MRATVPDAPVLPCVPPVVSRRLRSLRVVMRSTVARSPQVGLVTHNPVGRVSRFELALSPVGPCPCRPNLTCFTNRVEARNYALARAHPAAPGCLPRQHLFDARGFRSLLRLATEVVSYPALWRVQWRLAASPRSVYRLTPSRWQYACVTTYSDMSPRHICITE